jgi:hypothetical protein
MSRAKGHGEFGTSQMEVVLKFLSFTPPPAFYLLPPFCTDGENFSERKYIPSSRSKTCSWFVVYHYLDVLYELYLFSSFVLIYGGFITMIERQLNLVSML